MKRKVYLTLQNGASFQGYRFGATGNITGELVFSTGMVGYMETLTDPANYGQIVVQTFPLIGNYGAIRKDVEADKAWASAFIVREICDEPSNFRSEGKLEDYLVEQNVVGVYGVDTRELTKIIREKGAMNARISSKPLTEQEIKALASYKVENGVKTVAPTEKSVYGDENAKYTVALWNFGAKNSTVNNLADKGLRVISLPATATAEEVLATNADGIVLAGGAGNPAENTEIIEEIKKVLGKKPLFGMDYGHAFVALALGGKTAKQKYGHRGGNQPVKCEKCGRVYISSQNHGYEVVKGSVNVGETQFFNVNDGSCEGMDYPELKAFTVQFAPEACDLGNVENPLYKKFFALMEKEKENA